MIVRRVGTVLDAREEHAGLVCVRVEIDGSAADAVAYPDLVGDVVAGDEVLLNTTAVELGLGTGGVHVVIAVVSRRPQAQAASGHAMKLRYTPVQSAVDAVEDVYREAIDGLESLDGMPVVIAGLHSALTPSAIGARSMARDARIAYVMTDGAALHIGFSTTVPALRRAGLLDATITAGQATGGEHEAVTLYGALAAAKAVVGADITIVAMGPGNLGSGTRWGAASLETGEILNAVSAMGGRPVVAPRISFADGRERHRGVSHHTITALERIALASADVAVPAMEASRAALVAEQMRAAASRHAVMVVDVASVEDALMHSPVPLRSMGRSFNEDPDYFRAAAAAGVRAAQLIE